MAKSEPVAPRGKHPEPQRGELVIITGLSGSGKGTVLKAFEDLGYYAVDNLPIGLIPKFAELTREAANVRRAALVIDIREGQNLKHFPAIFQRLRRRVPATLLFLEADERTLVRRFSETRRPHPLGIGTSVLKSIRTERERLATHEAARGSLTGTGPNPLKRQAGPASVPTPLAGSLVRSAVSRRVSLACACVACRVT